MLEFSLVVNFLLICLLTYHMDKRAKLTKALEKVAKNNVYGGKGAWIHFHYMLMAYYDSQKYNKELEDALHELFMDRCSNDPILQKSFSELKEIYIERKIFTRNWKLRQFPRYGLKEINSLSDDFKQQIEMKEEYE